MRYARGAMAVWVRAAGPGWVKTAIALMVVLAGAMAAAQAPERVAPTRSYLTAFAPFYDGEYKDALRAFADEHRGAIKTPQSRWIDSICYETMLGECHYEMGALGKALEHYTNALKLYVAFYDWMIRVQFPAGIQPAVAAKPAPWGVSTRRTRLGRYPETMLISQGRINNMPQYQHGGVVQPATLYPIQVQEIVRATTLAIRRRAALLGPAAPHDPLTAEVAAALARRPGPPNHWSEAWVNVQLGLAMVASGRETQGIASLRQSLVAAGEFDHPLTSVALLELGRIALSHGDFAAAAKHFEEATYAAYHYPDAGVLEEAFRYGAITHMISNAKGIYPPLAAAAQWAKVKGLRQLQVSLLLSAAENHAMLGQTREAAALLEEARVAIGRRAMGAGRIGARLNMLTALVLFQQKRIPEGEAALASAMTYMQSGSHWLFHIQYCDNLLVSGALNTRGPRLAMELYREVLRDPQPADWAADPMEALAVLVTPHPLAYEHWFEVAIMRKEPELALEIADRARRHQFLATTALGGRLLALRWVLEAPPELLSQQAQLQRLDLLGRYPAYAQLSEQARAIRTALYSKPLVPAEVDASKEQAQALAQLATLSLQQEMILREMAVRREPAALVFPPLRTTQEVQKSLPDGTAVLAFFATSRHLYGFLMNNEKYAYWQIGQAAAVQKQLLALLADLGQYGPNYELSVKDLSDNKWRTTAAQLLELLLRGSKADFTQKFDELVIVPDGLLWYVPFEALTVNVDDQLRPMISRVRIRYAPTVSLVTSPGRPRATVGRTAVVLGKLHPREEPAVPQAAFEKLAKSMPGVEAVKTAPPAPSAVFSATLKRLIVFDEVNAALGGPYEWMPIGLDRTRPGNTLGDWLALPWHGPEEIILPGFHTHVESGLKTLPRQAPGSELFLSACALMASGARTILMSRWRTGGQSSYELVHEFVQELPHTSASDAWQRAVMLTAGSRLDIDAEPRIRKSAVDEWPRANHPFFWAGYMLIDCGAPLPQADKPAEPPVVKVKPEAQAINPAGPRPEQPQPDQLKPEQSKPDQAEPLQSTPEQAKPDQPEVDPQTPKQPEAPPGPSP